MDDIRNLARKARQAEFEAYLARLEAEQAAESGDADAFAKWEGYRERVEQTGQTATQRLHDAAERESDKARQARFDEEYGLAQADAASVPAVEDAWQDLADRAATTADTAEQRVDEAVRLEAEAGHYATRAARRPHLGRSAALIGAVVIISSGAFAIAWPRPTPVPGGPNEAMLPAGAVAAEAGRRAGLSTGDPHLITVDGLHFDFQASGDFVLARSNDGAFEIQVRQRRPVPGTPVAVNGAVAARMGDHRLGIYATASGTIVRVDGSNVSENVVRLDGGGRLEATASGWRLIWPDGTELEARLTTWLDVALTPGAALRGKIGGLLGDADGNPSDDLTARDGRRRDPAELDIEFLYKVFGESWRVNTTESLFDIDPDSAALNPDRHVGRESLDEPTQAHAEAICRAAGIAGQPFLDDCVLDVALTGNEAFAASSAWAARQLAGPGRPSMESGTATQLANGTGVSAPSLVVDRGGAVHATWRAGLTEEAVIVYRALAESPEWTEPVVLSDGLTYAGRPNLRARPDGTVCVTWWGVLRQASGLHQRCHDDGVWTGAELLQAGLTGSMSAVTTADGVVHTLLISGSGVRVDQRELNGQAHGSVFDGTLVAAGDVLHVVWLDDALRYRQSTDGGRTWSDAMLIGKRGWTRVDAATDSAGGLHVVFDGPDGLTYRHRTPGGAWNDPALLLSDDIAASRSLVVGPDQQPELFVARRNGIDRIVHRDDGWLPGERVAAQGTAVAEVAAAVGPDSDVHLIWITTADHTVVWYTELSGPRA
jgi:hypothetical protein